MRKSTLVGLVVIVGFVAFGASAFRNAATPYVSFAEARAAQSTVQVKGSLDTNSIRVDRGTHALCFDLVDETGGKMPVSYAKPEPGNFRQATEVVAVGRYNGRELQAENLLVKCPSKYQGRGTEHPEDAKIPSGES
ncbi:MAG: cytochrome c maturation protein CcmE [Armatimonadetes bacterium]|nr:cytochrome c maturation protein CcmE [Armatimonadota bacterium]